MERKFAEVGREGGLEERGARQEDSCPRETVMLQKTSKEAARGGAAVRTRRQGSRVHPRQGQCQWKEGRRNTRRERGVHTCGRLLEGWLDVGMSWGGKRTKEHRWGGLGPRAEGGAASVGDTERGTDGGDGSQGR